MPKSAKDVARDFSTVNKTATPDAVKKHAARQATTRSTLS